MATTTHKCAAPSESGRGGGEAVGGAGAVGCRRARLALALAGALLVILAGVAWPPGGARMPRGGACACPCDEHAQGSAREGGVGARAAGVSAREYAPYASLAPSPLAAVGTRARAPLGQPGTRGSAQAGVNGSSAALGHGRALGRASPRYSRRPERAVPLRRVLITGAAGYIGSHMVLLLLDEGGYEVTAVDDMSRSSWDTVVRLEELAGRARARGGGGGGATSFAFYEQDLADTAAMARLMRTKRVDVVIHFAGNAYVGESMAAPDKYYQNITIGTLQLLRAMDEASVKALVFSSSCATFGAPAEMPIVEDSPQVPTNPYGLSKLHAEQAILLKARVRHRVRQPFAVSSLRYFNVIGADPRGRLGPVLAHSEQLRFPRIVDAAMDAALGLRPALQLTGAEFPTPDGTAVRDYVHVSDLVRAHVLTLRALSDFEPLVYNVGNGRGSSVKEVVRVVEAVTRRKVPVQIAPARPGDPPTLYTDPQKIRTELAWAPELADLHAAIQTAWAWRVRRYPRAGGTELRASEPAGAQLLALGDAAPVDPLSYTWRRARAPPAPAAAADRSTPIKPGGRVLIVGSGPTAVCAAARLHELGHANWQLLYTGRGEQDSALGAGPDALELDDQGYTYDWGLAGGALISHAEIADRLLGAHTAPRDWLELWPSAAALVRPGAWAPLPLEGSLHALPAEEQLAVLHELASRTDHADVGPAARAGTEGSAPRSAARAAPRAPRSLAERLRDALGAPLAGLHAVPMAAREWGVPAHALSPAYSLGALGESQATAAAADAARALSSGAAGADADAEAAAGGGSGGGPLNFRGAALAMLQKGSGAGAAPRAHAPLAADGLVARVPRAGTARAWRAALAALPPSHVRAGAPALARLSRVVTTGSGKDGGASRSFAAHEHEAVLEGGERVRYSALLSTAPLDTLLHSVAPRGGALDAARERARPHLRRAHSHMVGLGVRGRLGGALRDGAHVLHLADDSQPCFRVTLLSALTPAAAPAQRDRHTLLCETRVPAPGAGAGAGAAPNGGRGLRSARAAGAAAAAARNESELISRVIGGLFEAGVIVPGAHVESARVRPGGPRPRPVPLSTRELALQWADSALRREASVWSRGALGAWQAEAESASVACLHGADAVDSILEGGGASGLEPAFNAPFDAQRGYRRHHRSEAAARAAAVARHGAAAAPHMPPQPAPSLPPHWLALSWRCSERDEAWIDGFTALVPADGVRFGVRVLERCEPQPPAPGGARGGALADASRHVLRTRAPPGAALALTNSSAIARAIAASYEQLPAWLFLVRPGTPEALFSPPARVRTLLGAPAGAGADGGADGARGLAVLAAAKPPVWARVDGLVGELCAAFRAALGVSHCPASTRVLRGWDVLVASSERVRRVPRARWEALAQLGERAADEEGARSLDELLLGLLPEALGGDAASLPAA